MPLTMPTGSVDEMKRKGEAFRPIILVDIITGDGTAYYFTNFEGSYPRNSDAANQAYSPWIKRAGPFKLNKSLRTDSGNIVLQNLSGNLIDRDVAAALDAREFEGAFVVVRLWQMQNGAAIRSFHGKLGEQDVNNDEVSFRVTQLLDGGDSEFPQRTVTEQCDLIYKADECGSVNAATTCDHTMAHCVTRGVPERFNGTASAPILVTIGPTIGNTIGPTGGPTGGGGPIDGPGGRSRIK